MPGDGQGDINRDPPFVVVSVCHCVVKDAKEVVSDCATTFFPDAMTRDALHASATSETAERGSGKACRTVR